MSFHYLPGQFRVPKIPNLTLPDGITSIGNGVFAGQRGLVGRLFLKKIAFFFVFYPIITTFVILLGFSENTANY